MQRAFKANFRAVIDSITVESEKFYLEKISSLVILHLYKKLLLNKNNILKIVCEHPSSFIDFPNVYVSQRLFNLHNIFCKKCDISKEYKIR